MDKAKLIGALEKLKSEAMGAYYHEGVFDSISLIEQWQDEPITKDKATCVLCAYRKAFKRLLADIVDLPKTGAEFFDDSIMEIFATSEQLVLSMAHWKGGNCNDADVFLKEEDGYFAE